LPEESEEVIESEEEGDDVDLPFPMAPIVRVIKDNLDEHKLVRRQVKERMNLWLGKMCAEVSKEMNKSPYPTVSVAMFNQAIQKYEAMDELKKEKERVVAGLQKIKLDCDSLMRDLDHKFDFDED
jgi:hypothetical protein